MSAPGYGSQIRAVGAVMTKKQSPNGRQPKKTKVVKIRLTISEKQMPWWPDVIELDRDTARCVAVCGWRGMYDFVKELGHVVPAGYIDKAR